MQINEIVEQLGLTVLVGADNLKTDVTGGYVADLLSCVIAGAKPHDLWVTLQTHVNIVAVAGLKEVAAIIVAEAAVVPEATLEKAAQQGVVMLSSPLPVYETVKQLVALGL
ncbi:MAG TPA: serine kinase [Anaerolineae bacterium]|nr:serine kinase [Anaerolineae bacterium]HQI87648.1 serine kinase [Anaerolineae bacterium]